ncbi:MAG: TatD family hydrolase [Muribaculaceae bacterium]|nr:TatD family hydrolase [Muribaculaceae bacterium]
MPKSKLLNFHSHNSDSRIINISLSAYTDYIPADDRQLLTVGIHPWDSESEQLAEFGYLSTALNDKRVVALGEVGIDPLRGAPIERQMFLLEAQLKYAVPLGLPIVFHIVRRHDLLLELYSKFRPSAPWAVHGFRGRPEVANKLAAVGIYMSVGKRFNAESVAAIPDNLLLVETDMDDDNTIFEVIAAVAQARNQSPEYVARICEANLARFYNL